MKRTGSIFTIALALCMCAGIAASAKVRNQTITFGQGFTIGGTPVKSGTYRLSYDDETNELTVVEKKTKVLVAKVAARAERLQQARPGVGVQMVRQGNAQFFISIAFPGDDRVIRVGESSAATASRK